MLLFVSSCTKDYLDLAPRHSTTDNDRTEIDYSVSKHEAIKVALKNRELESRENDLPEIDTSKVTCEPLREDDEGNAIIYVINLNPGFYLISADKRHDPVLAYSHKNDWQSGHEGPTIFVNQYTKEILRTKEKGVPEDNAMIAYWSWLLEEFKKSERTLENMQNTGGYVQNCTYGECRPKYCEE